MQTWLDQESDPGQMQPLQSLYRHTDSGATKSKRWNPQRDPLQVSVTVLLSKLQTKAQKTIQSRLATSTSNRHRYLREMFRYFLRHTRLTPTTQTLVLFLEWLRQGILDSTLLTYAKTMRSLFPILQGQTLDQYINGLKATGALIPHRQSHPIQRSTFYDAILPQAASPDPEIPLRLCRKLSSRWDEISRITKERVRQASPTEILVEFVDKTKCSRSRPFRPDMYVIMTAEEQIIARVMQYVNTLQPNQPITSWSTQKLATWLQRVTGDPSVGGQSIKRGALQDLMIAAAQGVIPLPLVSFMGKHLGASPMLAETTVRYLTDKIMLARATMTNKASEIL